MGSLKRAAVFVIVLALMLILASCEYFLSEKESNISYTPDVETNTNPTKDESIMSGKKRSEVIGAYQYPVNPAEQLRNALERDTNNRGLPIEIGNVEKVEFKGKECSQFKISFTNGNICLISFTNKYIDYGYEETLDGHDNPSFTMAFKDPDNSHDMITVLTSVINYISPELSFEEAKHMAIKQDNTISTDGYSMPQDIDGYQTLPMVSRDLEAFRWHKWQFF